jgi:hypothetical protein
MDFSQAAQGARHDQARAAQADVVAILGALARQREQWSRIDEATHVRVVALLEGLFAADADPGRVCRHARQAAFDRAPRPLVLDVMRGILACWDECYWAADGVGPVARGSVACFACGGRLDGPGPDLFIAYGPILVVAALCQRCRIPAPAEPADACDPDW